MLGGVIDLNPDNEDLDTSSGLMSHRMGEVWRRVLLHRWNMRGRVDAKL